MSVFSSAVRESKRFFGMASTSIISPVFKAWIGVTFASKMPFGMRMASVQKRSLPNVSKRNTSRPALALPTPLLGAMATSGLELAAGLTPWAKPPLTASTTAAVTPIRIGMPPRTNTNVLKVITVVGSAPNCSTLQSAHFARRE